MNNGDKLTNLVNFADLSSPNEEDSEYQTFVDKLRGGVYKGAFFVRKEDGDYLFGCTEVNRVAQERMLYHLKETIEFAINNLTDIEMLKETVMLLHNQGVDFDVEKDSLTEVVDINFFDEEDND